MSDLDAGALNLLVFTASFSSNCRMLPKSNSPVIQSTVFNGNVMMMLAVKGFPMIILSVIRVLVEIAVFSHLYYFGGVGGGPVVKFP